MVEQHFDRCGKAGGVKPVDGSKDPDGFGQRQNGYPSPFLHKAGGLSGLRSVVSGNEPNQNVGVNGAHSARACAAQSPLSSLRLSGVPLAPSGTTSVGCPPTRTGPRTVRRCSSPSLPPQKTPPG